MSGSPSREAEDDEDADVDGGGGDVIKLNGTALDDLSASGFIF